MSSHVIIQVFGSIRSTEQQVARALACIEGPHPQTEEAKSQLRGALMSLSELANNLGRQ